jgi:thioredoxin 1
VRQPEQNRVTSLAITKDTYQDVINNNPFVIIDFWAPWCGPCKSFGPVFEAISDKYPDIVFAKVNTEEEQELAGMFQIRSIPTLMMFREQIIIFSQPGALPGNALEQIITKANELDMEQVRQDIAAQQTEG